MKNSSQKLSRHVPLKDITLLYNLWENNPVLLLCLWNYIRLFSPF
jgi:hypothetical protein